MKELNSATERPRNHSGSVLRDSLNPPLLPVADDTVDWTLLRVAILAESK